MTTTDLYPYFIIIGTSILLAAGWLLYQYRKQQSITRDLIQLNEQLGHDLPNFLARCWPLLRRSGFSGMAWDLDWFGTRVRAEEGRVAGNALERSFEVQEIAVLIRLYRDKPQWEQRYFSDAQAENFFLLVRMNMWIKVGTVQGTFEQTARMTVFLKHDVKNMVQLLTLSAEQLDNTAPAQQESLLDGLRDTIPALRERAGHMLRALNDPATRRRREHSSHGDAPTLDLGELLQQSATLHDLQVRITGNVRIAQERDPLLGIIDNLLGNYSQLARANPARPMQLDIRLSIAGAAVTLTLEDIHGTPFPWPERLFEPFWSEHGTGRGIGLYQARQLAQALGGDLSATAPVDGPLRFLLRLPLTGAD